MISVSPAEQLLQSLGITDPREIDVEAIAWAVGAKVRNGKLTSCEARIIGFQDRAIITVRGDGDLRRRRFSIAHELGHWQFHRGRSSVCRPDDIGNPGQSGSPAERQADRYAADLLMPRYLFRSQALRYKRPSFEAIDELAEKFSTSRTATALRFVDLSPWPCILICHSPQGRRWFKRSSDAPERWFPMLELDPDSAAFDILYGNSDRSKLEKIGAEAWFDRREADRYTVIEQATKSFGGEVLALLTLDEAMLD